MSLPSLKIGDLIAEVPIIQGAMGVGISLSDLAGAVAKEGAVGVISGVQIGFNEPDFETNLDLANVRALKKHIQRAREVSPHGIIAVNLLTAISNYEEMVEAAVEEGVDLIVSGAGFPKNLPQMVEGTNTKVAPIISSAKGAALISKIWDRRFAKLPDLVIVEGAQAGGHLGFTKQELEAEEFAKLEDLVVDTKKALLPYETKYHTDIPVVPAGGIFDGEDIARFINLGAAGVQMASRFVGTHECDAHENFKSKYIEAEAEEVQLVDSPVGMPGRAISNAFTERVAKDKIGVTKCYNCLKPCDPQTTPYCISEALINACEGNVEEGLVFAGSNAFRLKEIISVKDLISDLVNEATTALEQ